MKSLRPQRWRNYLPSLFIFMLALFFYSFPRFTVFLVVGALIGIGLIYSLLVRKFHRMQDAHASYQRPMNDFEKEVYQNGGPNFKNITVSVFKSGQMNRFM